MQKENETEWETEVLDVFWVLAQVILMQTVMKTPVLQIADSVLEPFKTQESQLEM